MADQITDPETGKIYKRVGARLVDITPTPEQAAVRQQGPMSAAITTMGRVAESLALSIAENAAIAPGLSFAPTAPRPMDQAQGYQLRAAARARQLEIDQQQGVVSQEFPVASLLGAAVPAAGAMALPAARGGVGRMVATEGGIGAGMGFFGRPGSMGERVQNAAIGGALSAAGAGVLGAASRTVGTGVRVATETADEIRGRITGQLRADYELEALTGAPRLGAAADREYRALASNADLPADMSPTQRNLALRAEQLGIPLTTGRRTQNTALMQWESGLARIPAYSGPFTKLKVAEQGAVNDYAAKAIGQYDEATRGTLSRDQVGAALRDLSDGFEDVARKLPEVELTPEFASRLDAIERETDTVIGAMQPVFENIRRLRAKFTSEGPDGEEIMEAITGRQLMDARSQINNELRRLASAAQSNRTGVEQTEKMMDLVDDMFKDAAERGGKPNLVSEYGRLRDTWRFADMLDRYRLVDEAGNLSPRRFRHAADRRYVNEYRRAELTPEYVRRPIRDALDATKVANGMANPIPDSGTPTGNFVQNFINEPIKTTIRGTGNITIGRLAFEAQRAGGGREMVERAIEGIAQPSRPAMIFGATTGATAAQELAREENP